MRCPFCSEEHASGTYVCPKTQQRITGILSEGTDVDGKYKILGVLGTGGMAAVYRAEHVKIGRVVALKLLLPEFVAYPELVTRVEREARAAGGVDHPNVVEIVDLGSTPQYGPYIAMELLKGVDLATYAEKRGGKLPSIEAAEIIRQVLSALQAAHERGVIHRDLKPENVFLAEDDDRFRIKVLDFGISKVAVEGKGVSSLTRTGTVLGTPQFMAPEQAAGARDQDHRVDIYATGVVLYAILTGQLPYEADNYNLLINEVLNKPPRPILTRDPSLDSRLAKIVMHSLEREPRRRFQSAGEMHDALAKWLDLHGGASASGWVRRISTGPHTAERRAISGRGIRRPSAPDALPAASEDSATVSARGMRDDDGLSMAEIEEATTSLQVPPPSEEVQDSSEAPKDSALRSNTHTPLGWENTPAGMPAPTLRRKRAPVLIPAMAVVLAAASAFAARAWAPAQWNAAVHKVGLDQFAVAVAPHATPTHGSGGSHVASHGHVEADSSDHVHADPQAATPQGAHDIATSTDHSTAASDHSATRPVPQRNGHRPTTQTHHTTTAHHAVQHPRHH